MPYLCLVHISGMRSFSCKRASPVQTGCVITCHAAIIRANTLGAGQNCKDIDYCPSLVCFQLPKPA